MTPEEITAQVNAAFDSVELINKNEDSVETIQRNIEHLRIMMKKEWFVQALTTNQKNQIKTIINV